MDNKLEPPTCCWSGCMEVITGDLEYGAWWGPFIYCPKHNAEMQADYESYLAESYSDTPDLEDIF